MIQGEDTGQRFELQPGPMCVGRGVHSDVRLSDAEVSRTHVCIEPAERGFVLRDEGSANGTLVNGRRVSVHPLRTGDQIQIGRTVLVFDAGDSSEPLVLRSDVRFSEAGVDDESHIVHRIGPDDTRTFVSSEIHTAPEVGPQHLSGLQTLYRVLEEAANATASLDQMLQNVLDLALAATGADRGSVLLLEDGTDRLVPASFSRGAAFGSGAPMTISRTIVNYVATERQGVRTSDARADTRFASGNSIIASGIREALCVPMIGMSDLIGVIYLDTTSLPEGLQDRLEHVDALTDDHLKLVLAIGRQVALAIERRRYQQALLKAERLAAVGQTITMLSHHVKNILQGVRGGSYLIETGLTQADEDMIRQGWGIVDRNQDRIYNLVMDMLTFSAEKKPALTRASLNAVVREVCELMQGRAAEFDVELQFAPDEQVPETAFDTHGLHRAVLNVVTNAIEAVEGMPDAQVVVSTTQTSAGALVVSVQDNGPGIPPEQLGQLFNVFESTKGSRGTGLGLAVSQKILAEHGGRIDVDSDLSRGTTFRLVLPRLELVHPDRPTDAGV